MTPLPAYDAILLAGGSARRLGGVDKAGVQVAGRSLGARTAAAVADAGRLVVVGGAHAGLHPRMVLTQEDPPGTGPVAATAAGLRLVTAAYVAVLACDLPFLTADAIAALRTALVAAPGVSAAMPVDARGSDQPLCSVWRSGALGEALARFGDVAGASVRALVAHAEPVIRLPAPSTVADGRPPPWFDCDTADDLARADAWAKTGFEPA